MMSHITIVMKRDLLWYAWSVHVENRIAELVSDLAFFSMRGLKAVCGTLEVEGNDVTCDVTLTLLMDLTTVLG
jgi:hypothetical protein